MILRLCNGRILLVSAYQKNLDSWAWLFKKLDTWQLKKLSLLYPREFLWNTLNELPRSDCYSIYERKVWFPVIHYNWLKLFLQYNFKICKKFHTRKPLCAYMESDKHCVTLLALILILECLTKFNLIQILIETQKLLSYSSLAVRSIRTPLKTTYTGD